MQDMSTRGGTLTAPQQALQSYLDELLQDAALELDQSQAGVDDFEAAVREEQRRDNERVQQPSPEAKVELPAAKPMAPVGLTATPEKAALVTAPIAEAAVSARVTPRVQAPVAAPPPPVVLDGRPSWAEEPFECLLFDVAGLTLAVPLVCLGTVYSLRGRELTPIFGQPDWFLGMLSAPSGNIKVLDTARWVMPERYREECREDLKFVITIQGYDWGLAVHQVDRSIHLRPEQVKWRTQRTQRPWLAGTVIEHMCALLDVAALAELIRSGAHTRTS